MILNDITLLMRAGRRLLFTHGMVSITPLARLGIIHNWCTICM